MCLWVMVPIKRDTSAFTLLLKGSMLLWSSPFMRMLVIFLPSILSLQGEKYNFLEEKSCGITIHSLEGVRKDIGGGVSERSIVRDMQW